jgi:hypothetical protein
MRKIVGTAAPVLVALATFTGVSEAQAELGSKGNFALGAERVWGLSVGEISADPGDLDYTYFALAGSRTPVSPFETPRLAFDYFAWDSLSLGGSIMYSNRSFDNDDDDDDDSSFLIAPRVGYAIPFGAGNSGVWLRGGLSYYHNDFGNSDEGGFGLNLDAMFYIGLTPGFALTLGPTVDLGFGGEVDTPAGDFDRNYRAFGFAGGLTGWF